MEEDWNGCLYCVITLNWHYKEQYVDITIPNYVPNQLLTYGRPPPKRAQYTPFEPRPINYGAKYDTIIHEYPGKLLGDSDKKYIQQVLGSFLYYARAIDMKILLALNDIATQQAKPTESTTKRVHQLLDYMAMHPKAIIRFHASFMILNIHSDASYCSAGRGRSQASGYFFLGSIPVNRQPIKLNGNIHITCDILKLVADYAAEAELGTLFINARESKLLRITLHKLGHPKPPTPFHVENTSAVGIVNNTIKRQRSRATEMRYFWLLDQYCQKYLDIYHQPGQENLGNYPTKNHTGTVTQHVRPYYIHESTSPTLLPRAMMPSAWRGCAEILGDTYHRQVPLPRITNNQSQESTCDPAHPCVQTFGTSVQMKRFQRKPEQSFVQLQRRTDLIKRYTNIRTQ